MLHNAPGVRERQTEHPTNITPCIYSQNNPKYLHSAQINVQQCILCYGIKFELA